MSNYDQQPATRNQQPAAGQLSAIITSPGPQSINWPISCFVAHLNFGQTRKLLPVRRVEALGWLHIKLGKLDSNQAEAEQVVLNQLADRRRDLASEAACRLAGHQNWEHFWLVCASSLSQSVARLLVCWLALLTSTAFCLTRQCYPTSASRADRWLQLARLCAQTRDLFFELRIQQCCSMFTPIRSEE